MLVAEVSVICGHTADARRLQKISPQTLCRKSKEAHLP